MTNLNPGEMNAAIAKVLGWKTTTKNGRMVWLEPDNPGSPTTNYTLIKLGPRHWSTTDKCWELVDSLLVKRYALTLKYLPFFKNSWKCEFHAGSRVFRGESENRPEAICRAYLAAKEAGA